MAANRSSALNGENGTISKSKDGSSLQPVSGIHSTLLQQLSSLPVIMSAQPVIQKNSQLPFGQKPQSSQQQQTQTQQQQTQQQMQQRQQPPLAPHNQQHNQATVQLQQMPQLTSIPASSIMSGLTLLPVSAAAGVSQKNQDAKTVQPGFFLVQSSAVCSAKSGDLGNALTKSTPLFILSPSSVQPQLLLQGQQMQQTLPSSVVSLSSGQNFVISAEMLSQLQKPQQIQQLILPDTVSNFSMPIVTTTMTAPESTSNDTHFSTPSTELKIETAGSMQPESEKVELEDLEKFAKVFKQRRVELGYTQGDIGLALGKLHGNDFSQTTISRFEALNLSFNNMCKLKPLLQKWLDVADAMAAPAHPNSEGNDPSDSNSRRRKHRTSIDSAIRAVLERNFQENSKPTSAQLRAWADSLHLDKEVVRIWFCNRRQKDKRINLPLLSSSSVGASIPSICSEADAVVTVPPASRSSRIEPIAIFPIVAGSVNSFQS